MSFLDPLPDRARRVDRDEPELPTIYWARQRRRYPRLRHLLLLPTTASITAWESTSRQDDIRRTHTADPAAKEHTPSLIASCLPARALRTDAGTAPVLTSSSLASLGNSGRHPAGLTRPTARMNCSTKSLGHACSATRASTDPDSPCAAWDDAHRATGHRCSSPPTPPIERYAGTPGRYGPARQHLDPVAAPVFGEVPVIVKRQVDGLQDQHRHDFRIKLLASRRLLAFLLESTPQHFDGRTGTPRRPASRREERASRPSRREDPVARTRQREPAANGWPTGAASSAGTAARSTQG